MKSLRSQFNTLIILAVIICVAAIGAVSIHIIRVSSDRSSNEVLLLSEEKTGHEMDVYLNSVEQCVDTVVYYASNEITGTSDEELAPYLSDVDLLFHSVANSTDGVITYYYRIAPEVNINEKGFWYSRAGGDTFASAELTDLAAYDKNDPTRTAWYYTPKEKGAAVWLEPYTNDNLGGIEMISYVTPVYWKGQFIGVLGIDYDYEKFKNFVEADDDTFNHTYTFLTNEDDEIVYHPELKPGTPVSEISESLASSQLSDEDRIVHFSNNGRRERAAWGRLTNGMRLYYAVPETEITGIWLRLAMIIIGIGLIILAIFLFLTTRTVDRITAPLSTLTEAARKIDEGDYNVRLDYNGKDEIGVLTAAFRQLTSHLEAYISDLNDMAFKDALTHLKNKGAFDNYMHKLEDRVRLADHDSKPAFAICVFDCNDLKTINDTYGHDKGDIYLRNACGVICEVFKHSPVFRLGGDEFATILQNDDYFNRLELCMAFDHRAEELSKEAENEWEKVSIASGIAVFDPDRDNNVGDVMKRADKRMYEDKARKKDGIIRDLTPEMVSY